MWFVVSMLIMGVALCYQNISDVLRLGHDAGVGIGSSLVGGAVITGAFYYFDTLRQAREGRREEQRHEFERDQDRLRADQQQHHDFILQLSLERDLRGLLLDQLELPGVFLRHKNLSSASVRKTDLTGADLSFSDLTGADLREAKLAGARANESTKFVDALLAGAKLDGVRFLAVHAAGANLAGASAVHANFRGCDFARAVLTGADLRFANFSDANLTSADFTGAVIRGARFGGADLTGVINMPSQA